MKKKIIIYSVVLFAFLILIVCFLQNLDCKEESISFKKKKKPTKTLRKTTLKAEKKEQLFKNKKVLFPSNIIIAGKPYGIFFENTQLSREIKKIIIEDLNLNMAHLRSFSFLYIGKEKIGNIPINYVMGKIKPKRYYPKQLKCFGGAVKDGENYTIIVPIKIINAYKKAIKLKKTNQDAFEKVNEFCFLLNSPAMIDEQIKDIKKTRSLFFSSPFKKDQDFVNNLLKIKKIKIRKPSLLDFKIVEIKNRRYLSFCTLQHYLRDNGTTSESVKGALLYIYEKGSWKIYNPFWR